MSADELASPVTDGGSLLPIPGSAHGATPLDGAAPAVGSAAAALPRPAGAVKSIRTGAQRLADHAAIDRLVEDLLPALAAKLAASGLGEIEVGEDDWTVRVRRPADGSSGNPRRASDRASRSQPGHSGHGHAPGGFEGHRGARDAKSAPGSVLHAGSTNGSGPAPSEGRDGTPGGPASDGHRAIATSPAVGVFQPRSDLKPGSRVRSGDRLGAVDMLGVPQEVLAPAAGILGGTLAEPGQPVEYGQDLIVIELAARAPDRSDG